MSTPKFKIGDRVKWAIFGNVLQHGVIVECVLGRGCWRIREPDGTQWAWHESLLSLDVPAEPKQFATNRAVELGVEIINLNYRVADQKKEIERLTRINTKHLYDAAELSRRLTEEIGGCHRERIAKESAQKELVEANAKIKRCKSLVGEM